MSLRGRMSPYVPTLDDEFIPATAFAITSGTPELVEIGTTNIPGWALDPDAIEKVGVLWDIPKGAQLLNALSIDWAVAADPSGGVVMWGAKYALLAAGDNINEPTSPFWNPQAAASAEDLLANLDVGIAEVEVGDADVLALYIWRAATNAADDLAADAYFAGARVNWGHFG